MRTMAKIIGAIYTPYGAALFLSKGLLLDIDTLTIWKGLEQDPLSTEGERRKFDERYASVQFK
jgi:hypothetical protein